MLADGRPVEMVDLPGAYSLEPASPDEAVTRDVILGQQAGERLPSALIVVVPLLLRTSSATVIVCGVLPAEAEATGTVAV